MDDGAPIPDAADASPSALPIGVRVGALLLLINAAIVLSQSVILDLDGANAMLSPIGSAVVDVLIGIQLLRGQLAWRIWAIVRCTLGTLLFVGMNVSAGDVFAAVLQSTVGVSLLTALVGDASRMRIGVALTLFTPYLLLTALVFTQKFVDWNPLPGLIMEMSGELEPGEVTLVTGVSRAWTLSSAPGWRARRADVAQRDNPLADRWLVLPDVDAHVMVIVEPIERGSVVLISNYRDAVLENARRNASATLLHEEALPDGSLLLHLSGRVEQEAFDFEQYLRIVVRPDSAYQVIGFTRTSRFEGMRLELRSMLDSFQPAAVDDSAELEPGEAGVVTGSARAWTLASPEGWRVRRADVAARENPLADRWLVRPGLDAQLLVVVEAIEPGTMVTLADYRDAIVADTEERLAATLLSEETLSDGTLLLRFRGRPPNVSGEIEKHVRLVVRPDAAYQVVGLVGAVSLPLAELEIRAMLESFVAP